MALVHHSISQNKQVNQKPITFGGKNMLRGRESPYETTVNCNKTERSCQPL